MGLLPMDLDILPPSDDRVFKLILTAPDAKPVLMDLISSIIQRAVVGVEVRNNEIPPNDTDEKAVRFDVNCKIDDGSQVDLEMQASRIQEDKDGNHQNLKGKSVYYLCDLHSSQSSKGVKRYDHLARTYQVTFCSYTVFPDRTEYVNSFSMRHDKDNALLSDAIHVVYVELSKLREIMKKSVSDMTDLEKWAVFFRYADEPKHRDTVNEVIASKEALKMAGNLLMSISQDERERAVFRSRKMYRTDYESDMATSWDNGKREGMEIGRREGMEIERRNSNMEFARKLLRRNRPLEEIMEDTGLTHDEIERIRSEIS